MTKTEAIRLAGGEAALAAILGITRQAVNLWRDDTIPARSLRLLQALRPAWFKKAKIQGAAQ